MAASALATSRELQKLGKAKAKETAETEKGIPLAPSAKDLKPWYSEKRKDDEVPADDLERYVNMLLSMCSTRLIARS